MGKMREYGQSSFTGGVSKKLIPNVGNPNE